jgi:hypothetical protein
MGAVVASLAASLVSFAVLYLLLERRIRRRVDPETILGQIRREIEGLIVDMNQTTERALSLLEEKMSAAKQVVEDSERRLKTLRREAETLERAGKTYAALRDAPAANAPFLDPAREAPPGRGRRAGHRTGRPRAAPERPGAALESPEPAAERAADAEVGEPPVRDRIVSLHRAGISVDSIVRRLGVPRATVDLVVSLEDQESRKDLDTETGA